ncbi:MAG: hypothetical protein IKW81_02450 [Pseudobutyrivibrio sp.]|nr:hypothetical protein [Pseudobutyrivibrio sp.]
MRLRQVIVIVIFFSIGVICSFVTNNPWYYIPSSLVIGVLLALFAIKNH